MKESNNKFKRRTVLSSTLAAASLGGSSGVVRGDDDSTDDLPSITERDEIEFDRDTSAAWILERFIEMDSADHPLVGQEVTFEGVVIANLENESENIQLVDKFQWKNFHFAGSQIISPLIGKLSWANPLSRLTQEFYERIGVLSIAGIQAADQRFYDRYEAVPIVTGFVPDEDGPPEGTLARFVGTVQYADSEESLAESRDGPYVEVHTVEEFDSYTSLNTDDEPGDSITFVGRKRTEEDTLSTFSTDLEFDKQNSLPNPSDGSLVYLEGQIRDADFQVNNLVRDYQVTVDADYVDVLIGDTNKRDPLEREGFDIVLVMDVSGSMREQDTRSGDTRLSVAKQSAKTLVNLIENPSRVGLVSFSTYAAQETPLLEVNPETRAEIENAADSLTAGDQTSIGAGLRAAIDLFGTEARPKVIFLLSDGEENTAPYVNEVMRDIKANDISIHTVGMGENIDEPQLRRIAEETEGTASFAPDPSDIRELYHKQASELLDRPNLTTSDSPNRRNGGDDEATIRGSLAVSRSPGVGTATDLQSAPESGVSIQNADEESQLEGTAIVDASCEDVQFSASGEQEDIQLQVVQPDDTILTEGDGVSHRTGSGFDIWTVEDPTPGEWGYIVPQPGPQTRVEVTARTPVDTELFVSDDVYDQTGLLKLEVKAVEGIERYEGAEVEIQTTPLNSQKSAETVELTDNGTGPDRVADDGIYTAYFHPEHPGDWRFSGRINGGTVSDLHREFGEQIQIQEVINNPIRPYKPKSSSAIPDIGIVIMGATLFAGIGQLLKRMSDNDLSSEGYQEKKE